MIIINYFGVKIQSSISNKKKMARIFKIKHEKKNELFWREKSKVQFHIPKKKNILAKKSKNMNFTFEVIKGMSQNLFLNTLSIQGWEIVSHLKHSCEGTHHISPLYYKMCNVVSWKKVKVYQMHSLIWICTGCPGKFWIHFSAIFQRT